MAGELPFSEAEEAFGKWCSDNGGEYTPVEESISGEHATCDIGGDEVAIREGLADLGGVFINQDINDERDGVLMGNLHEHGEDGIHFSADRMMTEGLGSEYSTGQEMSEFSGDDLEGEPLVFKNRHDHIIVRPPGSDEPPTWN